MLKTRVVEEVGRSDLPAMNSIATFFYYEDVRQAVDWYEIHLGLTRVFDDGWVAILAVASGAYIGLVNTTDGVLRPRTGTDKTAILAIETDQLEDWYERLSGSGAVHVAQPIHAGAKGGTEAFHVHDPGGYIVEFFRWRRRPDAWRAIPPADVRNSADL